MCTLGVRGSQLHFGSGIQYVYWRVTSFIGRQREIGEVKQLLATIRLVTLTGAGGVGKPRLALQIASEVLERFTGGVWMAEFAALSEPTLVVKTGRVCS